MLEVGLTYEDFISILYSLHGPQLEREFRLESRYEVNVEFKVFRDILTRIHKVICAVSPSYSDSFLVDSGGKF